MQGPEHRTSTVGNPWQFPQAKETVGMQQLQVQQIRLTIRLSFSKRTTEWHKV
jgi:hypothetical protein